MNYNIDTRSAARRTSQSELDTTRARAAGVGASEDYRVGGVARPRNPEIQAWGKGELESRVRRTVMGKWGAKGRYPMHVLTPDQFSSFQTTGTWEGMPTSEEYGPHSEVPEDKEYT